MQSNLMKRRSTQGTSWRPVQVETCVSPEGSWGILGCSTLPRQFWRSLDLCFGSISCCRTSNQGYTGGYGRMPFWFGMPLALYGSPTLDKTKGSQTIIDDGTQRNPANHQREGPRIPAWFCSRFLPVKLEYFLGGQASGL